jgi:sulfatase modifying factor 1
MYSMPRTFAVTSRRAWIVPAATALCAWMLALSGCVIGGKDESHGSEVENEILGATIYLADGTPAAGARVRVFRVEHNPQAAPKASATRGVVFSTRTDSKGHYKVDSLERGEYNILSDLEGEVAYQDSVSLSPTTGKIEPDTLREPGSVTGRAALQPNHDPRTVTVQVLGTNVFVEADDSGSFTINGLAAGAYRIRLTTTLSEYTALNRDIRIVTGKSDTLPAPLVPTYTGIPVVEGLRAAYDTLAGTVYLDWKPVRFSSFQDYRVYRNDADELDPEPVLIARPTDTAFADVLFRPEYPAGMPLAERLARLDTTDAGFEYRVAVGDKGRGIGKTYGYARVRVANPLMARTHMEIRKQGVVANQASIGDTVAFIVSYANRTRRNAQVRWHLTGTPGSERDVSVDGFTGSDTLRYVWSHVSRPVVNVVIRDEAGSEWRDSTYLYIVKAVPSVAAGPDQRVSIGDTVKLQGEATDVFGPIVKWEWDIGGTGVFTETSGAGTRFTAPGAPARIRCVFRAKNADGNVEEDELWVAVEQDMPQAVTMKEIAVFPGDSLKLVGKGMDGLGRVTSLEWDIGNTGTFIRVSTGDTVILSGSGLGMETHILRVTDDDGNRIQDTLIVHRPLAMEFVEVPAGSVVSSTGQVVQVKGFRMLTTEVTRGQFFAVMGRMPGAEQGNLSLPVTGVLLVDAIEFCNRVGKRQGLPPAYYRPENSAFIGEHIPTAVRIPSRNQWENAARAGNSDSYWQTALPDSLDPYTWYAANSSGRAHPVAGKLPNGFGLYDMNGNVAELTGLTDKEFYPPLSMGSSWNSDYASRDEMISKFVRGSYIYVKTDIDVGFRVVISQRADQ